LELYPVYSDVPVRRSSFSDRVYGTVTVWYGPKPYYTVEGNIRSKPCWYGHRFMPFCREKGGPGFSSRSELSLLLFHPNLLCVLFLLENSS